MIVEPTNEQAEILGAAVQFGHQIVVGDPDGFWRALADKKMLKEVEHPLAFGAITAYELTTRGRAFLLGFDKPGYWYLHTNGEFIHKPFTVVDMGGGPKEYFDSPFVQEWWRVEEEKTDDS